MQITTPRIVIAGTHSGCGKTTVASGLMAAFTEQGLRVQPFKTGPDFIDPSHHSLICSRTSRNLDPFIMGNGGVLRTFARASGDADIAVIEGAMGLFDGIGSTDTASTAHVARILRAPVILVVDAASSSRSIHAVILGFSDFDPRIRIAGIIFNRIATDSHREMIASARKVPALGWIYQSRDHEVKSRHLGLVMAHETDGFKACGRMIRESCDTGAILGVARNAPSLEAVPVRKIPVIETRAVIGVAQDEAFCFYYQDNLDRLARTGAQIRPFSPVHDPLPDVDAVYLGGGYPELHARELEGSRCRDELRSMAEKGMPVLGECGGLMYLCGSLHADKNYRMADILPAHAEMTSSIQALGYVKGNYTGDPGPWAGPGTVLGHEFHFSDVECDSDARFAIHLSHGKGIHAGNDGLTEGSAIGTYSHAYFSDAFCRQFISAARDFRRRQ